MLTATIVMALAQGAAVPKDDTIVVLGERLVDDTALAIERIDPSRFAFSPDVAAALTNSPSVEVITNGPAARTELFLRGGDSNFAAVSLDGVQLNDVTDNRGGAVDLSAIAPFEVGNAVLRKGAVSVLQGSAALSGHVALETEDPLTAPTFAARVRAAEGGLIGGNVGWSPLRSEAIGLRLTATAFDQGDLPGGQGASRASLGAKMTGALAAGQVTASVRHGRTEREVFPDASGGDRLAASPDLEESEANLTTASLRYVGDERAWTPSFALSYLRRSDDRVSPAVPPQVPAGTTDSTYQRFSGVATVRTQLRAQWQGLVGAEVTHEDGDVEGTLDYGGPLPVGFSQERTTPSVFAEARREPRGADGASVYLGVRADHVEGGQLVPTARAGITVPVAIGTDTELFANVGNGFKAPSFFALSDPLVGNPDLEDERSVSGEAGLRSALPGGGDAALSVHHTRYRNIIDFDWETFSQVNRDSVEITGVEGTLTQPLGRHEVAVFATLLDVDAPEGALLARPDWRAGASWRWASDRFKAYASYKIRSKIDASSVPTGVATLDGSSRLDGYLGVVVSEGLVLALTGDDVFASENEAAPGFSPYGRRVGVRLDFAY
ncbi:TonB-dependent receptor plug domain-containing protein [Parvularcula dongshanensis]|uniref:Vitamin B12 transporter n=1 Tax=Parvularcula dongshanensis TaxID=1173995 RepID=A0A840I046_9PROT|nr:TonB-dependent receptor [Parvularcula dongshanensis]MBB4657538.1 vitamin B12 transporter [Parvularcula dongshanensis]